MLDVYEGCACRRKGEPALGGEGAAASGNEAVVP
jgi:hypothetical protein